MPKKFKHYTVIHQKPKTHPYTSCRWCHYKFSSLRGHHAQSPNCKKLELADLAKRPIPDPIPFHNFAIVTSLQQISNYNTLDEYEQAKKPERTERSSKYPSRSNKNKTIIPDIIIANNDPSYRYTADDVSVMNPGVDDIPREFTQVYKTIISNVDNDIASIESDNYKINSLDLMCDNETNISFPDFEIIDSDDDKKTKTKISFIDFDNIDSDDDKENSLVLMRDKQANIRYSEVETEVILGNTDIVQLHKNNSTRDYLSKLNAGQENNIHTSSTGIPRAIVSEYNSYCVIYDVLNKAHVPLYMYDKIIKVIMEEVRSERITTKTKFMCRRSLLKWMQTTFRGVPKPVKNIIQLETNHGNNGHGNLNHRSLTEVITFDFKEQLIYLLSDVELFSNMDNLVVNKDRHHPNKKWLPYEGRSDGRWTHIRNT